MTLEELLIIRKMLNWVVGASPLMQAEAIRIIDREIKLKEMDPRKHE